MRLLRLLCMFLVLGCCFGSRGQAPGKASATIAVNTPWPKRTVRFQHEDPVLGLPSGFNRSSPKCSADGRTYFEVKDGAEPGKGVASLYSVSESGETRLLPRKLPSDYPSVMVKDFFPGEHTLVTLVQAEKANEADPAAPPREVRYFLSLSDHDGDGAELVPLDVHFRLVRVAMFGSGDFLLMGWDEVNLMPVLAVVKDTGEIHRFIDLSGGPTGNRLTAEIPKLESGDAALRSSAMAEELARGSFVPYGEQVLLTFPGTTRSFQVWNVLGVSQTIPWGLPPGFVLHDVLVSGAGLNMVVRVRPIPEAKAGEQGNGESPLPERLFEISYRGGLLREFVMDKPAVSDITCAPKGSRLTAIFMDQLADQGDGKGATQNAPKPDRLVISTAPR